MVVALGGNTILSNDASAHAQQQALVQTSAYLVHLIKQGASVDCFTWQWSTSRKSIIATTSG